MNISLIKDIVAKHIYGYQKHVRFTEAMLEGILKVKPGTFKGSTILNSVKLTKNNINDKYLEMDILVELPNKEIICIEFYNRYDLSSEIKSFMYISRVISSYLNVGEEYKTHAKPITQINFVKNDQIHKNINKEFIRKYLIINENDPHDFILNDLFKMYIIDVDLLKDISYDLDDEFKRWIALIGADTLEDIKMIAKGHKIMEEISEEIERFTSNKWMGNGLFHRDVLLKSQAHSDGVEEGISQNKIEIAKNLLKLKITDDDIIKATNITLDELEELKRNI